MENTNDKLIKAVQEELQGIKNELSNAKAEIQNLQKLTNDLAKPRIDYVSATEERFIQLKQTLDRYSSQASVGFSFGIWTKHFIMLGAWLMLLVGILTFIQKYF